MALTVNNTTANTRVTIIFDAGGPLDGNGPASGTGNTESDVYVDSKVYFNIRSHTEIDANVHALQWNASAGTGVLEYTDNRENESLSSFPQWASNVIIRCEAQDIWQSTYDSNVASQKTTWIDGGNVEDEFVANVSMATSQADTERNTYLSAHSITY